MRFQRSFALLAVALLVWAVGPLALLVALGSLAVPRVRRWLRPTWRVVAGGAGVLAVLVATVVLLPDGALPIPPGMGSLTTPRYLGSPGTPDPIDLQVPQHPRLAVNGTSGLHNDGWSTDAYPGPGPLGESPSVDTAWYGVEGCATLAFDTQDRIVALCHDVDGPVLHVLDPETMRAQASLVLPGRPEEDLCGRPSFFLDDQDRAVTSPPSARSSR